MIAGKLIATVWLVGGLLFVGCILYGNGWREMVEEMEEDNPGYPILGPKGTAYFTLLLGFFCWPYVVIETVIRRIKANKED